HGPVARSPTTRAPFFGVARSGRRTRAPLGDRAQAVRADVERHVQQVEVVLDRVEPGDGDDLALVEVLAERREGRVVDVAGAGRLLDVGQGGALALREARAGPEVGDVVQLGEQI